MSRFLLSCAIRAIRRPAGGGAWSGMAILSDVRCRARCPAGPGLRLTRCRAGPVVRHGLNHLGSSRIPARAGARQVIGRAQDDPPRAALARRTIRRKPPPRRECARRSSQVPITHREAYTKSRSSLSPIIWQSGRADAIAAWSTDQHVRAALSFATRSRGVRTRLVPAQGSLVITNALGASGVPGTGTDLVTQP